jgi:hypothetical protein
MEVIIFPASFHPDAPANHFFIAFGIIIVLGFRKPMVSRYGLPLTACQTAR